MKALYCAACGSIIGLPQDDKIWGCRCNRVYARWVDPKRGTCMFAETADPVNALADDPPVSLAAPLYAWLLGINNAILRGAQAKEPRGPSYLEYRDWMNAEGTLFKTYESVIIRVRPGETSDSQFVSMERLREREEKLTTTNADFDDLAV
jgi:hypothetical protein